MTLEDVEELIFADKIQSFEEFDYVMKRLVMQRSTKLYQMFDDFKKVYLNTVITLRNHLLCEIRKAVQHNWQRQYLLRMNETQQNDFKVRIHVEGHKKEFLLSNLSLNNLMIIYDDLQSILAKENISQVPK